MADTFTANLALILPDLGDTFDFNAHVIANFTTIDTLMGAVQCTSTTRPSDTYAGQIIYETDSHRYAQNTGTKVSPVWTYMSHAAMAATASSRPTSGRSVGQLIYETDTTRLLVWNGASWENKAFANFVCTSSAHPTSAFQGLQIFETDTNNSLIYDGSGYRLIQLGAWTTYPVTWSTSGTQPAVNNGVLLGSYMKIGRTVTVRVSLQFGTTTTLGTNAWQFSLPFTPANNGSADAHVGSVHANNSGVNFYAGAAVISNKLSSTTVELATVAGAMWGSTVPAAWTISGSYLAFTLTYESTS